MEMRPTYTKGAAHFGHPSLIPACLPCHSTPKRNGGNRDIGSHTRPIGNPTSHLYLPIHTHNLVNGLLQAGDTVITAFAITHFHVVKLTTIVRCSHERMA